MQSSVPLHSLPSSEQIAYLTRQLLLNQRIIAALLKEKKLYTAALKEKSRQNKLLKEKLREKMGNDEFLLENIQANAREKPNNDVLNESSKNPQKKASLGNNSLRPKLECKNCQKLNLEAQLFEDKISKEIAVLSENLQSLQGELSTFRPQQNQSRPKSPTYKPEEKSMKWYKPIDDFLTFRDQNEMKIESESSSEFLDKYRADFLEKEEEKNKKYRKSLEKIKKAEGEEELEGVERIEEQIERMKVKKNYGGF